MMQLSILDSILGQEQDQLKYDQQVTNVEFEHRKADLQGKQALMALMKSKQKNEEKLAKEIESKQESMYAEAGMPVIG